MYDVLDISSKYTSLAQAQAHIDTPYASTWAKTRRVRRVIHANEM